MTKKMKRLLSLVLSLSLLLGAIYIPASAAKAMTDVGDHWGRPAITWVLERGYMNGVGGGKFDPNGTVKRAQVAMVLYNLAGRPDVSGQENPFTDSRNHWAKDAITWAAGKKIIKGVSSTRFAPEQRVTRAQAATMFQRYAEQDTGNAHNDFTLDSRYLDKYPDKSKIEEWYVDGVNWAVQYGFMQGSSGKLNPAGNLTRAQLAQLIRNYFEPLDVTPPDSGEAPENFDQLAMLEYGRAATYGFMPSGVNASSPDTQTLTWKNYCEMLGKVIEKENPSKLPEWTAMTKNAPSTPMKRDGAFIAILYAAHTLGWDKTNAPFWYRHREGFDENSQYTMDYPVFPWTEPIRCPDEVLAGFENDGNPIGISFTYVLGRESQATGRTLFNFYNGDPLLTKPLTLRAGAISVVRLYESEEKFPAEYVDLSEIGSYDKSIITDELLNGDSKLPIDVSRGKPSANWHGSGLDKRKEPEHNRTYGYTNFKEADFAFLHDQGLNFTKLYYRLSSLRHPDYPDDMNLVNLEELRDLDQAIAWGIEYDVHIMLSPNDVPDGTISVELTDEQWEDFRLYWAALAKRYKDIPNRYLSFELIGERQPSENERDRAINKMEEVAKGIWKEDPQRLACISFQSSPDIKWVEAMAKIGLGINPHPYLPSYLVTGGEQFTAPQFLWPYPYFPTALHTGENLTISGDIGGKTLKIDFWAYEPFRIVYDNGTSVDIRIPEDQLFNNDGPKRTKTPYPVEIPAGVTKLTLTAAENEPAFHEIIMESDSGPMGLVPHDWIQGVSTGNTDLKWDNKTGWSSDVNCTAEYIYENQVLPIQKIAEKYGVGMVITEFGVYAEGNMDVNIAAAYDSAMIKTFRRHGISWSLACTDYHLMCYEDNPYPYSNGTMLSKTYIFDDGTGRTINWCKERVEALR